MIDMVNSLFNKAVLFENITEFVENITEFVRPRAGSGSCGFLLE